MYTAGVRMEQKRQNLHEPWKREGKNGWMEFMIKSEMSIYACILEKYIVFSTLTTACYYVGRGVARKFSRWDFEIFCIEKI